MAVVVERSLGKREERRHVIADKDKPRRWQVLVHCKPRNSLVRLVVDTRKIARAGMLAQFAIREGILA
jgi:hypothetical protein